MYDRSVFRAVARDKGDKHYNTVAKRLDIAPVTAWRLWHGKAAPSTRIAAAVESTYGLSASQLLRLLPQTDTTSATEQEGEDDGEAEEVAA